MSKRNLLVIGNGMVGQRLLEKLAAASHDYDVTVLCEEPRPAYDRVGLTSFFSGKSAEDLSLVPAGFFESSGIALHLNERADAIDPRQPNIEQNKRVGRVGHFFEAFFATRRSIGGIAFVFEDAFQRLPDAWFVVDNEDSGHTGNSMMNRVPQGTLGSAPM